MFLKYPHCVKSVQLRTYFRSVFSCIRRTENGPEMTPYLDTFQAVPNLYPIIGLSLFTYKSPEIKVN